MTDTTIDLGTPATEQGITAIAEQQQQGNETASQTEPGAKETATKEAEKPKVETPAWAQKRFDQLTAKLRQTEAALVAERQTRQPESSGDSPPDFESKVYEKAQELTEQNAFNTACNSVYQAGVKEHTEPVFRSAINTLESVTGDSYQEILKISLESENPASLLMHLAANPDLAMNLADLKPLAQGKEIARLETMLANKKIAGASKAPAPISGLSGTVNSASLAGTANEDEWYARREAEIRKRKG